jgi:hypothetical protein
MPTATLPELQLDVGSSTPAFVEASPTRQRRVLNTSGGTIYYATGPNVGSGDTSVAVGAEATFTNSQFIVSASHSKVLVFAYFDEATQTEFDTLTTNLAANLAAHSVVATNAKTANYILALTDAGKAVEMAHASDRTITVPPNTDVAFPVGTVVEVARMGAGAVTLVAGAGVTIRSAGDLLAISAQYAGASLRQRAADEWVLNGSLA